MIARIPWEGEAKEIFNTDPETKIVRLTQEQMELMYNGNVVPQGEAVYYFLPFVFKQLGSSNVFEVTLMHKIDMSKVGFSQEFLAEITSSFSEIENMKNRENS